MGTASAMTERSMCPPTIRFNRPVLTGPGESRECEHDRPPDAGGSAKNERSFPFE
jgi:hypothetical protein